MKAAEKVMNIKTHCRTNLDDYQRARFPTEMCCRPLIGDRVQSQSGKILYVCGVTHSFMPGTNSPILEVELSILNPLSFK